MSRLPFELMLALRYLRPKRTFVSVITLISIIGVMLGVAVLIVVISVMSGFDRQLREKIFGFSAHIRVTGYQDTLRDYRRLIPIISEHPEVLGVSPYVQGPTVIETQAGDRPRKIAAPLFRGVDPELEANVSAIPNSVIAGEFDPESGVVVGSQLAASLGLRVGDPIAIYSYGILHKLRDAIDQQNENPSLPLPDDYEVVGIFDAGYFEYNANFMISSLFDAQDLFGFEDEVHGLYVILKDPYRAGLVQRDLQKQLGPSYPVNTWMDDYSSILSALVVEKNMIRFLLFFIVLVAAFGITSSQITFVVQKTREIGMLKALGTTSAQIVAVFMAQSLIVGVVGVLTGLGLGTLAIRYRNEFLHVMNRVTGFELFPANIYGFNQLPAIVDSTDLMVICGGSLLICLLAGVFPAINGGRLQPVEALRHE